MRSLASKGWLLIFIFISVAALGRAPAAAAQELGEVPEGGEALDPVEVTHVVFPESIGRDLGPSGGWLAVYLQIRCRGERAETVTVEARIDPGGKTGPPFVTQRRFEVAPGAPRKAWIYLRAMPGVDAQVASLVVRCRGKTIRAGDRWTINSYEHDVASVPTILVVGGEETEHRPWPRGLAVDRSGTEVSSEAVCWFAPHQLPDRALGYQAMDLVILRGVEEKRLEPSQIEALRQFVFLGGFLVLVPAARDGRIFRGELARELLGDALSDVDIEQGFRPRNLYYRGTSWGIRRGEAWQPTGMSVSPYAEEKDIALPEDVSYTRTDPFRSAEKFLREIRSHEKKELESVEALEADGALLYAELSYGGGRVGAFTVNDQAFEYRRSIAFRVGLWSRVVLALNDPLAGKWRQAAASFVQPGMVNSCLKDSKRDIGTFLIGSMVVGYLILVGPGIYFYLRRKNRLHSIIWVEPLVILLSLGAIFFTGYFTKGLLTKARLVTLFHRRDGESLTLRESYLSMFSADDADYSIECPRGDLLIPIFANSKEAQEVRFYHRPSALRSAEGGVGAGRLGMGGFHLNLWQRGYALNAGVEDMGPGVSVRELADPQAGAGGGDDPGGSSGPPLRVAVTNHLPYTILRGTVYHDGESRELPGRIPGGETLVVDFASPEIASEDSARGSESAAASDPAKVMAKFRDRGLGSLRRRPGGGGELRFWGLLDRNDDDFRVDRSFSVADRKDFFILYR